MERERKKRRERGGGRKTWDSLYNYTLQKLSLLSYYFGCALYTPFFSLSLFWPPSHPTRLSYPPTPLTLPHTHTYTHPLFRPPTKSRDPRRRSASVHQFGSRATAARFLCVCVCESSIRTRSTVELVRIVCPIAE